MGALIPLTNERTGFAFGNRQAVGLYSQRVRPNYREMSIISLAARMAGRAVDFRFRGLTTGSAVNHTHPDGHFATVICAPSQTLYPRNYQY